MSYLDSWRFLALLMGELIVRPVAGAIAERAFAEVWAALYFFESITSALGADSPALNDDVTGITAVRRPNKTVQPSPWGAACCVSGF